MSRLSNIGKLTGSTLDGYGLEYSGQLYCVHGQHLGRGTFTGHSLGAGSSDASCPLVIHATKSLI